MRKVRGLRLLATISCTVLWSTGAIGQDACPDRWSLYPNKGCKVTYTKVATSNEDAWRHLQLIQVHLRELDTQNQLAAAGCDTDDAKVSCEDVENAREKSTWGKLKNVKTLTFWIAPEDWTETKKSLWNGAYERFKADNPKTSAPPNEGNEGVIAYSAVTTAPPAPPVCGPPDYSLPCYPRAWCTSTGKCSKSTTSCVACNPPP